MHPRSKRLLGKRYKILPNFGLSAAAPTYDYKFVSGFPTAEDNPKLWKIITQPKIKKKQI